MNNYQPKFKQIKENDEYIIYVIPFDDKDKYVIYRGNSPINNKDMQNSIIIFI